MKNKFLVGSIVGGAVMLIVLVIAGIAYGNASATNMKCPKSKVCYIAIHKNGKKACKFHVNSPWSWLLPKQRCGQEEEPIPSQPPNDPTEAPGISPMPTAKKPTENPVDPPKTQVPQMTSTPTPTLPVPTLYFFKESSDVCLSECDAQGTQLSAMSTIAAAQATQAYAASKDIDP